MKNDPGSLRRLSSFLALSGLGLAACGSPSVVAPTTARPATTSGPADGSGQRGGGVSVEAEIGSLEPAEIRARFEAASPAVEACHRESLRRLPQLGGTVRLHVETYASGAAPLLFLEESTLGDRELDRCLLAAFAEQRWPKPAGGQRGIAIQEFDLAPPPGSRAPVELEEEDILETLEDEAEHLSACTAGVRGAAIWATVYIDDDGSGEHGRALSAGVIARQHIPKETLDCLAGVLASARYPSPGSWLGKVTFPL